MREPRVGLLPLYLSLYDEVRQSSRPQVEEFYESIAAEIEKRGVAVVRTPVCRIESEFAASLETFEGEGVDAVVTLHLAYSPSLESADILARTPLPLVVLDTTPSWDFGPNQVPDQIMYNHGIHGVQDMCNLLLRRGKKFVIEAGHWQNSDVLERVVGRIQSAHLASRMKGARVGLIGEPFRGMGDFSVKPSVLEENIGMKILPLELERLPGLLKGVTKAEMEEEREADAALYRRGEFSEEAYERSLRLALALKRWVEEDGLTAWSFNFLHIERAAGFETVPFMAASKLMARGIGYAGEGDVLTAALVGTLASLYPETSFTEMFCPDWKRGALFLSHMGEMNPSLSSGKAELGERDYEFSDTADPVLISGRFRSGGLVLVDLAPLAGGRFRLILSPATMLDVKGEDNMAGLVRGWLEPRLPLVKFLESYSRAGGTHHLALVYGAEIGTIETFGAMMGWEVVPL